MLDNMISSGLLALMVAFLLLLLGDFLSTFFYHVPEHVFGKFHTLIHHGKNRNFFHYAVLTKNPLVLFDGILGALPYFVFTPWFWQISPIGTILGLILGEFHVVWRHVFVLEYPTPNIVQKICRFFFITTPEIHSQHHQNAMVAYGDIFTFFDQPARAWLRFLGSVSSRTIR